MAKIGCASLLDLVPGETGAVAKTFFSTAATAAIYGYMRPSVFTAIAKTAPVQKSVVPVHEEFPTLKTISSSFAPNYLLKTVVKNVGIQFLMKFNRYLLEVLDHERASLEASEKGEEVPEAPTTPDFTPVLFTGLFQSAREVTVMTVRRVYERLAVTRLPRVHAEAILLESRSYIRDILSLRHAKDPLLKRLATYQSATLHSVALFYAAECTVASSLYAIQTARRSDLTAGQKIALVSKGAALHLLRCSVTLAMVSVGAALGSAIKPGVGTFVGHVGTDVITSITMSIFIRSVLGN
eukprot:CAMPEP_0175054346 /NCGR_PEP_ID=MMETSP0052_2-20121109/9452_1 /TAXON_ID=51329 ORGANISM="Polytomella parva, Strain SAG 63-3" /NCGR_SAMPLE_ID=MMETSP0052_2 /ASSEMBLY_ACC=CAM_ASM_000194 /LENGTH=295 /DNA_ID=CAMNT_0016319027 /DNA_START=49 /DNA_END=936 /DNA_ORIENTATION=+